MNVKLDMNTLNCVLLVVVLSLVIMCCMKSNNENFESQEVKHLRFLKERLKKCETERGLYNPKPTPTQVPTDKVQMFANIVGTVDLKSGNTWKRQDKETDTLKFDKLDRADYKMLKEGGGNSSSYEKWRI